MAYFHEALNPHPERKQNEADYESQKRERKSGGEIIGEDEADLITNLPPKVKEILEKLSESGAKVEVMKV